MGIIVLKTRYSRESGYTEFRAFSDKKVIAAVATDNRISLMNAG